MGAILSPTTYANKIAVGDTVQKVLCDDRGPYEINTCFKPRLEVTKLRLCKKSSPYNDGLGWTCDDKKALELGVRTLQISATIAGACTANAPMVLLAVGLGQASLAAIDLTASFIKCEDLAKKRRLAKAVCHVLEENDVRCDPNKVDLNNFPDLEDYFWEQKNW